MSIFSPQVSLVEHVVRAVSVYVFLLVAIRVFGRRELGQLTPFDIIVLIALANVLQNAMSGPDSSITGGVVGALTFIFGSRALALFTARSRLAHRLVLGSPRELIRDGRPCTKAMRSENLSELDLLSAIRREGVENIADVKLAVYEPNGLISVIPKQPGARLDVGGQPM